MGRKGRNTEGVRGKEDIFAQVHYLNIISKTLLIEQIKYILSILLQNISHLESLLDVSTPLFPIGSFS